MPFNAGVKKLIVFDKKKGTYRSCLFCGRDHLRPDAAHIIDEKEWVEKMGHDSKINGMPLCPNCHRSFDEIIRPRLYQALKKFGIKNPPKSWEKSNKLSINSKSLNLE